MHQGPYEIIITIKSDLTSLWRPIKINKMQIS
jgi:hypothetical protein